MTLRKQYTKVAQLLLDWQFIAREVGTRFIASVGKG